MRPWIGWACLVGVACAVVRNQGGHTIASGVSWECTESGVAIRVQAPGGASSLVLADSGVTDLKSPRDAWTVEVGSVGQSAGMHMFGAAECKLGASLGSGAFVTAGRGRILVDPSARAHVLLGVEGQGVAFVARRWDMGNTLTFRLEREKDVFCALGRPQDEDAGVLLSRRLGGLLAPVLKLGPTNISASESFCGIECMTTPGFGVAWRDEVGSMSLVWGGDGQYVDRRVERPQ